MNMGQDRQMQMVGGNGENQFRQYAGQNVGNLNGYNAVQNVKNQVAQNPRVQNVRNQNGLIGVLGNANLNENGNLVAARAEGNVARHNGNQIRCYNCMGVVILLGIAWLDQGEGMLLIFRHNLDEIEEVNANCILMANLQQTSTSGTQSDKALVYDSDGSAESCEKMEQLNKEIKPANYTKINHLSRVFVSQTAKSREELYFSNDSKTANVSKSISIPNEEFSDDTTPSVARKLLNEVKSTIVTLQCVVKHIMTLETHNWSSFAHQELHKIVKDENFPIVNQVDARVKFFEIQLMKEATKFVRDFKSLAKEADESLTKHKALELEIERLLRVVVSQDIMFVVQNNSVVDTSNHQTELERIDNTKTRRPQPRSNTKNDRVPSTFKNSRSKNKGAEVEEHHRNLLLFKNKKHMSFACNNFTLDSQNVSPKVVCAMCKQCLISVNHDECLLNYVYDKNSRESKFKTPCSIINDKYMMKAQVHVSKLSTISDVQALPQKKHY
uniref:Uncharacterized protein n=1 Tax=Tanacetum cinerariifolium TaxID=118510 RepID=A0A699GNC9_TANCI|nr:hypothetical protein [Tanacetum cinerariifolium]